MKWKPEHTGYTLSIPLCVCVCVWMFSRKSKQTKPLGKLNHLGKKKKKGIGLNLEKFSDILLKSECKGI